MSNMTAPKPSDEMINEIKKHSWTEMLKEYSSCCQDLLKIGELANNAIKAIEESEDLKHYIDDIEKYNLCVVGIATDIQEISNQIYAIKQLHKSKLGQVTSRQDMVTFSVCLNAYMEVRTKLFNLSLLPVTTLANILSEATQKKHESEANQTNDTLVTEGVL